MKIIFVVQDWLNLKFCEMTWNLVQAVKKVSVFCGLEKFLAAIVGKQKLNNSFPTILYNTLFTPIKFTN